MAKGARPVSFRGKWRIRWFDHEGKRQSAVFESHAEAETELRRRQLEATDVRAGLRRPSPADHSFGEVCDYWNEHRAPLTRSEKDDNSIIRAHLQPAFGALRMRDISTEKIDAFKEARAHLAPMTLRNVLVLLDSMFRQAEELGWLHTAPLIRKPAGDPDDEIDPPWLQAEEIDRLLEAARAEAKPDLPLTEVPHVLYNGRLHRAPRGRACRAQVDRHRSRTPNHQCAPELRRENQNASEPAPRADRGRALAGAPRVEAALPEHRHSFFQISRAECCSPARACSRRCSIVRTRPAPGSGTRRLV